MRLRGKVAIVTGGASGIGEATAELFCEEGASVVVADIDAPAGQAMIQKKRSGPGSIRFIEADISKEEDARKISAEAVKAFGRLDILVNNAAAFVLKGVDATVEDWQRSLGTNVIGTALVTKYAVEQMKKSKKGAIINLSSISGFVAQPEFVTYSSTKAAILQMTRNLAMDLGPHNIRVNAICPGTILTPASHRHIEKEGLTLEQFDAQEGAKAFLGRIGRPREVAYAILFLASDEASFITGTFLFVDGGYTAQ